MINKYRSKLDQAKIIFAQHNYLRTVNRVDVENFIQQLQHIGGTTDEALKQSTEADLVECGLPKLVARQILTIFQETIPAGVLETGQEGRLTYAR